MNDRAQVEKTADRLRSGLMVTLRELERRRHEASDLGRYVRAYGKTAGLWVGGASVVLAGVLITRGILRRRAYARMLPRERWLALRRAWLHPDAIAMARRLPPRASAELGKRIVVAFAAALATQVGRRAAKNLLPSGR